MTDSQTRGRLTLLLITALFVTPIIVAMFLYFGDTEWRPAQSTQKGTLITPPIVLPEDSFAAAPEDLRFREVWSLVVMAGERCDAICVEALEHIRQIRLSLGPKMTRMQTVYLPGAPAAIAPLDLAEFPKLLIIDPADSLALRELMTNPDNGEIFLVDPLGNVMMSYPPGTSMGDVRKDLGHLFKLSGIG
jgi:hypothetical protein